VIYVTSDLQNRKYVFLFTHTCTGTSQNIAIDAGEKKEVDMPLAKLGH
jgi:hypothetical protein